MSQRMLDLLRDLPAALGDLGHGDPDEPGRVLAADVVRWAAAEIARLREERLTAGEREALELSLELQWPRTAAQLKALARCLGPVCIVPENHYKASVRAFLERQPLPPGPEANG